MTDPEAALLDGMVEAIVREVGPEKIILFGSRTGRSAGPDSDIDLLIIEKKPFGPERSRRNELSRIRRALSPFRVSKDILVFSKDEVEKWKNSLNHLIAVCIREGHVLYERH